MPKLSTYEKVALTLAAIVGTTSVLLAVKQLSASPSPTIPVPPPVSGPYLTVTPTGPDATGQYGPNTNGTSTNGMQEAFLDSLAGRGSVYLKGSFPPQMTPIVAYLKNQQTSLQVTGDGELSSVINYQGTGYALSLSTLDVNIGSYYANVGNFEVECNPPTAGRNGISITKIGRTVYLHDTFVKDSDIAYDVEDTNTVYLTGVKASSCNTGVRMYGGVDSASVAIYLNGLTLTNCTNYGVDIEKGPTGTYGGSLIDVQGVIQLCGVGVYVLGANNVKIHDSDFELSTLYDVWFDGNPATGQANVVDNCSFNGQSGSRYAVFLGTGNQGAVTISNCTSFGHTGGMVGWADAPQSLTITNPNSTDPVLLDALNPTNVLAKIAGTVSDSRGTGEIYFSDAPYATGDVVVLLGNPQVGAVNVQGYDLPSAVMYGCLAPLKPLVIATQGIVQVNMDGLCVHGDTVVTSATPKMGTVDNTMLDSKKILGYVDVSGGPGLVWVRVGL